MAAVINAPLSWVPGSFGASLGLLFSLIGMFLLQAALVKAVGGAGALEAFSRSWRTVRGYAWPVFGTIVVVFLILVVGEAVLSAVLLALPYAHRGARRPRIVNRHGLIRPRGPMPDFSGSSRGTLPAGSGTVLPPLIPRGTPAAAAAGPAD
ncbi:MAG TPA: hypothetical protein VGD91_13955 [Trebonia sp.]